MEKTVEEGAGMMSGSKTFRDVNTSTAGNLISIFLMTDNKYGVYT